MILCKTCQIKTSTKRGYIYICNKCGKDRRRVTLTTPKCPKCKTEHLVIFIGFSKNLPATKEVCRKCNYLKIRIK